MNNLNEWLMLFMIAKLILLINHLRWELKCLITIFEASDSMASFLEGASYLSFPSQVST